MTRMFALAAAALLAAGCGVAEPPEAAAVPKSTQGAIVVARASEAPAAAPRPVSDGVYDEADYTTQRWNSYRDFWFDFGSARLDISENSKVTDVASYLRQNPSYSAAIDGATDPGDAGLGERRIAVVRSALVKAGVPEYKIRTGEFGDARFRRERRVEVLVMRY